ncbi:MAG: selenocysteine-specific translation elongation factor [Verrucomicrobia bacterium]|jgi:selenocysteine-specific elongation factor|nr:selenocysteine-specific translation elongation factor [Verrucomicrobiota bacterium]MBT7064982.1 selenocysteine-specific translation elongation factor [Verrucomicrobiota bacterium]
MPDAEARTVTLTVGTAGHIDHGKTQLVRFLTGCNTDRLPEEKARGMTIDLGFATCELPNQRRVGIVDVPGHERFIHNMVAGAAGIDVVVLVVAADDGIMPQTIEHFHIVRLLGVKSGLIVITKTDLVDRVRIQEVEAGIRHMTAGSFLERCPIVPFSSKTGAGFDGFYEAFVETVNRTAERDANGPFRMHVERAFILKGLGTIVSGVPSSGCVKLGDTVALLPGGATRTIRGIQVYGETAERGQNGECVALKLSNISREDITRGMVLATPDYFEPTRFINGKFNLLPELNKPIKPRTAIKVHIGTAQVAGHLVLPDLSPMRPGSSNYVQLQLKDPVVAAPGDLFVVRQLSPVRTIGGGRVVCCDHMRMRRSKGTWAADCAEREAAFEEPYSAMAYVIHNEGRAPLSLKRLSHLTFLNEAAAKEHLDALFTEGIVVPLAGNQFVHVDSVREAETRITDAMATLHDETRLSLGFPKRELFRLLEGCSRPIIDKALEQLLLNKTLGENSAGLQLTSRAASLSPRQVSLAQQILDRYETAAFRAPRKDELPELLGTPAPIINPIFAHLTQTGKLVPIGDSIFLHASHVAASRDAIIAHIKRHGSIDAPSCKDLFDTTRKYAIPILEFWDKQGLTRRTGNSRVLRERAPE